MKLHKFIIYEISMFKSGIEVRPSEFKRINKKVFFLLVLTLVDKKKCWFGFKSRNKT